MAAQRKYVLDNQRVILQGSSRKRKSSDSEIHSEFEPKKSRQNSTVLSGGDTLQREDPGEGGFSGCSSAPKRTKRKLTDVELGFGTEPKKSRPEEPPKTENAKKKKERNTLKKALKRVAKVRDATDFERKYEEHEHLGQGGFGSVYAGVRISDQQPVAIKHIGREDVEFVPLIFKDKKYDVPSEVLLMTRAAPDHHSVGLNPSVNLLNWYSLDEEHEVVLVMERPTPSQDLFFNWLENAPLSEGQAKVLMKQVVDALQDLHSKGIFHRDIKMENLLVQATESSLRIRIIDFGCGCDVQSQPYRRYKGTPEYAPPEAFIKKHYHAGPTSVWQTGALLYQLLRFNDDPEFTTKDVIKGKLRDLRGVSPECRDFLQACLTLDPNQRISLDQLSHHPWFNVA